MTLKPLSQYSADKSQTAERLAALGRVQCPSCGFIFSPHGDATTPRPPISPPKVFAARPGQAQPIAPPASTNPTVASPQAAERAIRQLRAAKPNVGDWSDQELAMYEAAARASMISHLPRYVRNRDGSVTEPGDTGHVPGAGKTYYPGAG